jgi:hypothetical protein
MSIMTGVINRIYGMLLLCISLYHTAVDLIYCLFNPYHPNLNPHIQGHVSQVSSGMTLKFSVGVLTELCHRCVTDVL